MGMAITESSHCNHWSPRTLEPVLSKKRSHCRWEAYAPQLEKSPHSNEDQAQPINKYFKGLWSHALLPKPSPATNKLCHLSHITSLSLNFLKYKGTQGSNPSPLHWQVDSLSVLGPKNRKIWREVVSAHPAPQCFGERSFGQAVN